MAKKNEGLTYEEKLEKSLVPDWEQPYKVPSNWIWTRLGETFEWGSGGTPSRKIQEYYTGTIPWIKTGELCDGYIYDTEEKITDEAIRKSSAKIFPVNTVIIAMYGATIGKVAILGMEATTNQACACAKPNRYIEVKYLFYFAISQKDNFIKKGKGGAQPNISQEIIKSHYFPLPPIAEQQRIVERIESLFSKLVEAKEKAQIALDSFEIRRAAILHKAFTGEITKIWREKNDVNLERWVIKEFSEVAKIKSNLVQPIDYMNAPHIAPDNIEKKTGVLLDYNTIAEDGVTSGKHRFNSGQILYSKIRPYLSKVVMVDFDGLCSADMYPIEANENVKYLWYYMLSDAFLDQASNAGSRSVLPKINQKEMSKIRVPMCNIEEQDEIVRILDKIFEKERHAKELVSVIDKIDNLKKAILARAFRGDLGTNNPEEESALELLKEILSSQDKTKQKPNKKTITIPSHISKQFKTDLEEQMYRIILENQKSTLNQILSSISSSKYLDAMEVITILYEKGLINKRDDLYSTK